MKNRFASLSLNRRDFVAATSAAAISHVVAGADPSRNAQNLAAHIHPDVQIVRDELAIEKNAFWSWKEADDKLTSLHDFSEDYFLNTVNGFAEFASAADFHDAIRKAAYPLAPFPREEAGKCVRAWLDKGKEQVGLVERGIATGDFQVPHKHLIEFLDNASQMEDLAIPRHVAHLKTILFGAYLNDNEPSLAAKTVADLLKMASMALSGDGYLLHYLGAFGLHRMATDAVYAFAFHPTSSRDSLDDVLRVLRNTRPDAESLARVFRVEVVYYAQREVACLPQSNDLTQLVDALIQRHLTVGGGRPDAVFSNDDEFGQVRRGLLRLFEEHPNPFDAADTIKMYSGVVAEMLSDLSSPWLSRKKELAKTWLREIEPWPGPLSFIDDLTFGLYGEQQEERTVTRKELEEARSALLRVHNPIGKHMLRHLGSFEFVRRLYHIGQLRTDIGSVLIACRVFRDQEKRFPHRLSELVAADLLDAVPLDPFSGREVRYDSDRRLIWSFGIDEKDDGGDSDFDPEFPDGKDIVWRLPA